MEKIRSGTQFRASRGEKESSRGIHTILQKLHRGLLIILAKSPAFYTTDLPVTSNLHPDTTKRSDKTQDPSLSLLNQAGTRIDKETQITADNIADFAYPLAQLVRKFEPDYIIACDRGARIIGLAVHMLYQKLYGALPTQDHSIHFRKISTSVHLDMVREALQPVVKQMIAATESPTVLVLDDFVDSGGTKKLVYDVLTELSGGQINVLYGVMTTEGVDGSGSRRCYSLGDWEGEPQRIGVDYTSFLRPSRVSSHFAIDYRKRMSASIDKFVKNLTYG